MKLKISPKFTRNLRIVLVTLASSNTLILVASVGFGSSGTSQSDLLLIPQINVCIITIFYAYFKLRVLPYPCAQLVISTLLAAVFLFFAGKVFRLLQGLSDLLWIVQGFNVVLAAVLLAEALCCFFVDKSEQELMTATRTANRRARETQNQRMAGAVGDNITTPTAVHLYQPRLDLSPPTEDATLYNRTSVLLSPAVDGETVVRLDIPDDYELDELPEYQRKPPAQSATIIDMANLASVSTAVLNNVVRPLSSSSMSMLSEAQPPSDSMMQEGQRPPSALGEQGGQTSQDEDIPSSDAPEYSPQPAPPSSSPLAPPSSLSPPPTSTTGPFSHATPEPPLYVP
jgi:hypothetical protein